MTATHRDYTRAEVVRLLTQREEIEEMQAAYDEWNSGARERPLRWQDRAVIVVITTAGCVLWLLEIARIARGVWWR
jgi:hypothetical protein